MTNKKVSITVMFGFLFTLSGLRAFAGEEAFNQLNDKALWAGENAGISDVTALPSAAAKGAADQLPGAAPAPAQIPVPAAQTLAAAPEVSVRAAAAATPPAPAPNPIKEFIGKYKTHMVLGGLGAYLGFALLGPAGILIGAAFLLGMLTLPSI